VLIINKIKVTAELLDASEKLKLVCEAATGTNNIDMKECERRGYLSRMWLVTPPPAWFRRHSCTCSLLLGTALTSTGK
jgi:hypothetical protein